MRNTKLISVWPVGIISELLYEAPILRDGKVCIAETHVTIKDIAFAQNFITALRNSQILFIE